MHQRLFQVQPYHICLLHGVWKRCENVTKNLEFSSKVCLQTNKDQYWLLIKFGKSELLLGYLFSVKMGLYSYIIRMFIAILSDLRNSAFFLSLFIQFFITTQLVYDEKHMAHALFSKRDLTACYFQAKRHSI